MSSRLVRISLFCAAVALFLPLSLVLFVKAQQRILRYRADELLAEIQSLNLRQSTFEQADQLRRKWRIWLKYETSSDCNPARCDFGIFLQDLSFRHQQMFERPWVSRAYEIAGGRPTLASMRLSVRNSVVWSKSLGVGIAVGSYDVGGNVFPILLEGSIGTVPRIGDLAILSRAHPEYRIWTHDRNPNLNVVFTPYASAQEIRRLTQFDLSCITRLRRCMKPQELMPNAGQQLVAESAAYKPDSKWTTCSPEVIELFSRDAENAAIVSVISHATLADTALGKLHDVTIRLDERLKRAAFWDIGATWTIALYPHDPLAGAIGTRWIVLFQGGGIVQRAGLHFEACTPLPLNEENLEIVRRGIARDDRPLDVWPRSE